MAKHIHRPSFQIFVLINFGTETTFGNLDHVPVFQYLLYPVGAEQLHAAVTYIDRDWKNE